MAKQGNKKIQVNRTELSAYQGPLPPASQLAQYEGILPGAAERIMKTYEKQVDHRHFIEKKYVTSNCINSRMGIIIGALFSLITIGMSGWLIYIGNTTGGSIIGGLQIASLAGVFVYGTRMKQK